MTDNLDKYLDSKLKKSGLTKTSSDFTRLLMDKVRTDYAIDAELRKRDRVANYIIGFFSSLIGVITIMAGYFYFSTRADDVSTLNNYIYSGSDTGVSFFERFITFIQTASLKAINFLGFSQTPSSLNIIFLLIISSGIYLIADRVFIKHKRHI